MKVLIVDDDPAIRSGLSAQIGNDGYEPLTARDGDEALAILTGDDPPAVALLDWLMPGRSGLEVCRAVRCAGMRVPPYMIMLTVKTEPRDIAAGLDAGCDDYIRKPFAMMELRARVRVGLRMIALRTDLQAQVERVEAALEEVRELSALLPICSYCRKVRDNDAYWHEIEQYLSEHTDTRFTHGICPECESKMDDSGHIPRED